MPQFFTSFFGINESYYTGKRVIDVGCGPIGTLEWASSAAERIGLDPLAQSYMRMNGGTHAMRYIAAPSEAIPFDDGYFDIVTMFNALDHVESVNDTISELVRVCRPGGDILIIVEINHPPSITEPHCLKENIANHFKNCDVKSSRIFGIRSDHDVYGSLIDKIPHASENDEGIVCLHLLKRAS